MADSGPVDTQASQPSLALRSRHVHVLLPSVVFLGEKTVYDMLSSVPLRLVLHLLQVRKLRLYNRRTHALPFDCTALLLRQSQPILNLKNPSISMQLSRELCVLAVRWRG